MTDNSAEKKATITLDAANSDPKFPAYQLSINAMDGEHSGHGYRLMGPKYIGRSRNLRTVELTQRDADEIRAILNEVFPPSDDTDKRHLDDGSTHTVQALQDAGESCVQRHCTAAREVSQLEQAAHEMRGHVDTALEELNYLIDDGTVTADAVDNVRRALRDALGLRTP